MKGVVILSSKDIIKIVGVSIISLIVLFFSIELISYVLYRSSFPDRVDWFYDDFSTGMEDWTGLDANYQQTSKEASGVVILAKDKYFAPSIMRSLNLTEMGQESFVYHFRVYVSSFQGDAMTLGVVTYASGLFTIVENEDGYLGISTDLMAEAEFSKNRNARVEKDTWQDIYFYYNNDANTIKLYNGKDRALILKNQTVSMPLSEIWLGSIWIGGTENYGAPMGVEYDDVSISNQGILPRLNFWEYIMSQF